MTDTAAHRRTRCFHPRSCVAFGTGVHEHENGQYLFLEAGGCAFLCDKCDTATKYLYLLPPPRISLVAVQSRYGLLKISHPPHLLRILGTQLSTTVGREGPMAWGFIRLHAIGPSPWKVDGSLNIKPSPFHSPSYTTVVVYITSRSHKASQDVQTVLTGCSSGQTLQRANCDYQKLHHSI